MSFIELTADIFWVGVIDWDIRYFHGPAYSTHRGTTYNSYLIRDEKNCLVDTVYTPFAEEFLANLRHLIRPETLDYIVLNHMERDHSGAFPRLMELAPQAQVFCTEKGAEGLRKQYGWTGPLTVVKTGTELKLGRRTLTFIEAPMLHWPDSMFTYVKEDGLLLPNDAFGQHLASSNRFDDEVDSTILMEEAAKYYANILAPFSGQVLRKLEEVGKMALPIKMIAPSHGVIWRKGIGEIVEAYRRWARGETKPAVVLAYDTMWGATEKMARAIAEGIMSAGVKVSVFKLSASDRNDIIRELLEARGLVLGSPTINNRYLPTLAPLLDDLKGLRFKNKLGWSFGAYGWGGGSVREINKELKEAGFELMEEGLGLKWMPDGDELHQCLELGKRIGQAVK